MFNEAKSGNFNTSEESLYSDTTEKNPVALEAELLANVSDARRTEIERYGRAETFSQIAEYLEGDRRIAFALVNYAPAVLDDDIDASGNKQRLLAARTILRDSFQGDYCSESTPELWEKQIAELGGVLARLHQDGFDGAEKVLGEVNNFWIIEGYNLDRREKVLDAEELDELNMNIGKSVGLQFLHLLAPELDEESKIAIAESYGLAIKLADNLSDLNEDLEAGFVNISREDLEKYNLDATELSEQNLRPYLKTELEKINKHYDASDECLDKTIKQCPDATQALMLFKQIAHSWLTQVREKYEQFEDDQPETPKYDYYAFYLHLIEHPLPRMAEYFEENYKYLTKLVGFESTSIDVGCGSGHVTQQVAPSVRRAIAIDHDPRMIQLAKERLRDQRNTEIVRGEFLEMDLPKMSDLTFASFNIVGSPDVASEDRTKFLQKMIDCTKSGGHVVADFWSDSGIEFAREFYIQSGSERVEIVGNDVIATDANGIARHVPRWSREEIEQLASQVSDNFQIVDLGGIFYALDITVE
ncbi:methyltransferase domain-containing protein [Patescibacteria group bacterium]|nr:methyltransferase domain-containing protein [Patescibacteria group bacterium]